MASQTRQPAAGDARDVAIGEGRSARVEVIEQRGDSFRLDVAREARWRVDVTPYDGLDVIASWNADGDLADVPVPDWLYRVIERLGFPGVRR